MINAEVVSAKLIEVKAIRIPQAHPSRTIFWRDWMMAMNSRVDSDGFG